MCQVVMSDVAKLFFVTSRMGLSVCQVVMFDVAKLFFVTISYRSRWKNDLVLCLWKFFKIFSLVFGILDIFMIRITHKIGINN